MKDTLADKDINLGVFKIAQLKNSQESLPSSRYEGRIIAENVNSVTRFTITLPMVSCGKIFLL